MAASDSIKPFSPEETRRILHHLQHPAVFTNMTHGWPALRWTAEHLSRCLGDKLIQFRLGRKDETNTPLFETHCFYVMANLEEFLSWTRDPTGTDVGPFLEYPKSEYWAYADYKYIAMLFQDQPSIFEDIKWPEFGFEGRNGRESTLWIGTEGANTPCHLDSYGFNLVLQVHGRKRWHLFPPEDTVHLYPTRIPFEESSVYSQVDVLRPDLQRFPAFQGAKAHVVTLHPGQVLYVPRHWWHYVESVDPITVSVNSWIELEEDDVMRVSEAVTKAVVCALKSVPSEDNTDDWLNPTEEGVASHNDNMQHLNLAVRAVAEKQRGRDPRDGCPVKRDSRGQIKKSSNAVPFVVPFGPHLIPVRCQQQERPPETRGATAKDPEVYSPGSRSVQSPAECTVDSGNAAQTIRHASVVGLHQGKSECSSGHVGSHDHIDTKPNNSSGGSEKPRHTTISTNDLLDCLVHPDVIAQVTRLLLERHTGNHRTTTPSWL